MNLRISKKKNSTKLTHKAPFKYSDSIAAITDIIHHEQRQSGLNPDCLSIIKSHGKKTKKAVVMLHGISACPQQFSELATLFFTAGYTVYVPRVPHHGYYNRAQHAAITTSELHTFLRQTARIAQGLGNDVGVIGLSGGATMATWLTQKTNVFSRSLLLSPFYEPSATHVAKWKIPYMKLLYGKNVLPNTFKGSLSVRAVAKYALLQKSFRQSTKVPTLKHLAVVTSELDADIDLSLAHAIPQRIKEMNNSSYQETQLMKEFDVLHNIVSPTASGMKRHKQQLYNLYFAMYENRQPSVEEKSTPIATT